MAHGGFFCLERLRKVQHMIAALSPIWVPPQVAERARCSQSPSGYPHLRTVLANQYTIRGVARSDSKNTPYWRSGTHHKI